MRTYYVSFSEQVRRHLLELEGVLVSDCVLRHSTPLELAGLVFCGSWEEIRV